uniref:Uncharacterized protein n=1 Tax=Melopsittacus undulatus TaxID=13146 RepID=A0A8V5H2H7_MELUD
GAQCCPRLTPPAGLGPQAPGPCTVSAALQEHLRHLTLQDFPCGLGSWNKSRFAARRSPHGGQPGLWAAPARQEEDVPLGEESPEALIELLKDQHSPWALPPGCSPQDQLLREVAVLEPELVHGSNVFQVLRSLRIVDKGVSAVDAGLLQLQQLEELILSANHISRVTSANLPRTLKVRNPLALIPTYRGFLVDSLPKLSILDDIHVGLDERHQFLGLASEPELTRSEARVVVSVGDMKGVPDPSTLQQLADDSDFPVITYSYCVTYEFVEGEELDDGSSAESLEGATLDADSSAQDTGETKNQQEPEATEDHVLGGPSVLRKENSLRGFLCPCTAKVFVTPGKPWEDIIHYSYRKEHIVKDLMGLKSYLAAGTIVSVVEEKVLSWPVEGPQPCTEACPCAGALQGPACKDKQKKKKKSCELRSEPPIRKTLGTRKVTLEALLATEDLVTALCDFGTLMTEEPPLTNFITGKKKSKDKSKAPKAESKSQAKEKASTSAKGDRDWGWLGSGW